jgi:hypothetical protein
VGCCFLRLKEGEVIFIGSADRKPDMMGEFYFMTVFSTNEMAGNSIAPMDSYKRIKSFFEEYCPENLEYSAFFQE